METVSVIIPCYNDGRYIGQAVESVSMQTYQHIELIIADDGSDDKATLQALNDLSFTNKKIILTKHVCSAIARDKCIAAARGSFILPLDSDDTIDTTYIEKAVHILEENPSIGIMYCQAAFFGEKGGKWDLPKYSLREMLVGNIIFSSAMFRKVDWKKTSGYNDSMKHGLEDDQIQEIQFHYRIKSVSRSSIIQKSMEMVQESYRQV